jgi:hypothetical protein
MPASPATAPFFNGLAHYRPHHIFGQMVLVDVIRRPKHDLYPFRGFSVYH